MTPLEIIVIVIAAVVGLAAIVALIFVIKGGSSKDKPYKNTKPPKQVMPQMPAAPDMQNSQPVKMQTSDVPFAPGLPEMLASHAKDFEGLYESLYVSCSQENAFDADAYHEWCERAGMNADRSFAEAFAGSFAKSDEPDACRSGSARLLSCIEKAGITRAGQSGAKLTFSEQDKDMYTCINSANAIGKTCTVVKPAWICAGKPVEQGVLMADNS